MVALEVGVMWLQEEEIIKCKRKLWGMMDMFVTLVAVMVSPV